MTTAPVRAHTITITETDRIAEIDPALWDRLANRASLYSAHAWLDYVEQYGDCTPCYLLVHQGDRTLGALPTYRFAGNIPRFYDPEFLVPGAEPGRPVLIAGTRQGYATEFLLDPDLDEPTRAAALLALLDRLRAEPAELTALLYVPEDALALVRPHLAAQDRTFLLDARARLSVDPAGLAGYRAVVSDNTKARMRKEMRRFADAGCRAEVRSLSECHDQLGELSAQVLQRYGHPITAEGEAGRFAAQAATLDDLCQVILARQGNRIVGFTQFFGWNGVLFGRLHGLDDTMARSAALYYNLTYYQAIEFAAAHGYTTIDLGCDSYEAKVRRGARLDLLWGLALAPGWSAETITALARAGCARLDEFTSWDPGVHTAIARDLLGPPTTRMRS
ncbi:MAG: GNAT family N-acetyltransferase [Actinobacteria bacterium]|nr:GNAT family N-acetyltransferase [Actinomycetota bacterium]